MSESNSLIKIKQFQSKYPFKGYSRKAFKNILYEGSVNDLPNDFFESIKDKNLEPGSKIEQGTKFIIVYEQ